MWKLIVATRSKCSVGAGDVNVDDNVWIDFDASRVFEGFKFLVADVFSDVVEFVDSECAVVRGFDGVTYPHPRTCDDFQTFNNSNAGFDVVADRWCVSKGGQDLGR